MMPGCPGRGSVYLRWGRVAYPPAACEWLYREILAGKPWAAVRESDPEHPAPERQWSLDFKDVAAAFDRLRAK